MFVLRPLIGFLGAGMIFTGIRKINRSIQKPICFSVKSSKISAPKKSVIK